MLPGASVKLVEQQTNVEVTTKVLSNGDFVLPVVQPGFYSITVEARGFEWFVKRDLVLTSNERLRRDTFLQVGSVTQSVTVSAALAPAQTTRAQNSGELDVHQLQNELAISDSVRRAFA